MSGEESDDLVSALAWLLETHAEHYPRADSITWRVYDLLDAIKAYREARALPASQFTAQYDPPWKNAEAELLRQCSSAPQEGA